MGHTHFEIIPEF